MIPATTYTTEQKSRCHDAFRTISERVPDTPPLNALTLALLEVYIAGMNYSNKPTTPTKKGDDPA